MGAKTRGSDIGATLITADLAGGEALAHACRRRGLDVEVREPRSLDHDVRDGVILDLEHEPDRIVATLHPAAQLAGRRVVVLGQAARDFDGLRVDCYVATTAHVDELVGAVNGVDGNHRSVVTAASDPVSVLTPRERDVLAELLAGRDAEAIAARLGVSANTARTHVQNIITKLGVNSRSEAAAWALRAGLSPASNHVRVLP
jgi:DNA-binding CsgD family transcriptional regulator